MDIQGRYLIKVVYEVNNSPILTVYDSSDQILRDHIRQTYAPQHLCLHECVHVFVCAIPDTVKV